MCKDVVLLANVKAKHILAGRNLQCALESILDKFEDNLQLSNMSNLRIEYYDVFKTTFYEILDLFPFLEFKQFVFGYW